MKYLVKFALGGPCRGYQTWEVEADSEDDAKEMFYEGTCIEDVIVRDDRERDEITAEPKEESDGQ